MSKASQTLHLVDELVKAKIPKKTATELLDYVESHKDKSINLQWVAIGILAGGLFGGLYHLSNRIDTTRTELKQDIKNIRTELKQDIKENRKLLLQLIQRK